MADFRLAAARAAADRRDAERVLGQLGWLRSAVGDKTAARTYYEQAPAIFQAIGMADRIRWTQGNLSALNTAEDAVATPLIPKGQQRKRSWWPFGH